MLPIFFPVVKYRDVDPTGAITLEKLCEMAQTPCGGIGPWTQRPIILKDASDCLGWIHAEAFSYGAVEIGVPHLPKSSQENVQRDKARWAIGALAYALFDGVARATIKGQPWREIDPELGPNTIFTNKRHSTNRTA